MIELNKCWSFSHIYQNGVSAVVLTLKTAMLPPPNYLAVYLAERTLINYLQELIKRFVFRCLPKLLRQRR